jgi:hypothetical protein
MKNSDDIIGNETRDFPTCSAVPQPTAPPPTPHFLPVTNQNRRFVPMKLFCIFLSSKCNSMQQDYLRVLVLCLLSVLCLISATVLCSHSTCKVNKRSLTDSVRVFRSSAFKRNPGYKVAAVATCCGLEGLGCEPLDGDKSFFSTPVQTSPGAHPGGFLVAERSGSGIYRSIYLVPRSRRV